MKNDRHRRLRRGLLLSCENRSAFARVAGVDKSRIQGALSEAIGDSVSESNMVTPLGKRIKAATAGLSALEISSSTARASIGRPSIRVSTIFVLSMGDQSRASSPLSLPSARSSRWAFEYFIANAAAALVFCSLNEFLHDARPSPLLNYSNSRLRARVKYRAHGRASSRD